MKRSESSILTINVGSSGIKFSLYQIEEMLKPLLYDVMESIGVKNATLNFTFTASKKQNSVNVDQPDTINFFLDWLEKQDVFKFISAIGHRIVHGMNHTEPELITPKLLNELKKISAIDPEHLPEGAQIITTSMCGVIKKKVPLPPLLI